MTEKIKPNVKKGDIVVFKEEDQTHELSDLTFDKQYTIFFDQYWGNFSVIDDAGDSNGSADPHTGIGFATVVSSLSQGVV